MKAALRRVLERAFAPIYVRLDGLAAMDQHLAVIHGQISARIDELNHRVAALEEILQTIEGRVGTVTERLFDYEEDQVRLSRRLDEIEKLLAGGRQ